MVIVLVPAGVTGLGAKPTLVPPGLPLADSVTESEKPLREPTSTVVVTAPPGHIAPALGCTARVKSALPHSSSLNTPTRVFQLEPELEA